MLFDFPQMMKYNVLIAKLQEYPAEVSEVVRTNISSFFAGGSAIMKTNYLKQEEINGKTWLNRIPGKIGILNVSNKYSINKKRLHDFMNSTTLPSAVVNTLVRLDDVIQKNIDLMFDVLNDEYSSNKETLLQADLVGAPFYGTIESQYSYRFYALEPFAKEVKRSIRVARDTH